MLEEIYNSLSYWVVPIFFIYYLIINSVYVFLLFMGARAIIRRNRELQLEDFTHDLQSELLPEITFLMAAYNEEKDIIAVVDNLIRLSYRNRKIIVVNDGSKDSTFDLLFKHLDLIQVPIPSRNEIPSKAIRGIYRGKTYQDVMVIDKENGGKFDALNAGLNFLYSHYFITIDADTYIDDTYFGEIIRPALTFPEVVAVGASVRLSNECTLKFNRIVTNEKPMTYFPGMQTIEYLRAFLLRQGWNYLKCNFLISGAFTMFVTDVVVHAGGFGPTGADDLEIILRLNRMLRDTKTPFEMSYLPDPVAWTEGPFRLKEMKKQRIDWQRGLLECLWFHKSVIFNPKYGRFGLFVVPMLVLGEAIEPMMEVLGFIYIITGLIIGALSPESVLLVLSIVWVGFFICTVFALFLEEISFRRLSSMKTLLKLIFYSSIEFITYHILHLYWRLLGIADFIKKFSIIRNRGQRINEMIEKIEKKGKFQW